jgi:hypothetical protein
MGRAHFLVGWLGRPETIVSRFCTLYSRRYNIRLVAAISKCGLGKFTHSDAYDAHLVLTRGQCFGKKRVDSVSRKTPSV